MFRLKPLAWWVVPWGLLAGLLLTLAFLGQMDFRNLPGCRQPVYGSGRGLPSDRRPMTEPFEAPPIAVLRHPAGAVPY